MKKILIFLFLMGAFNSFASELVNRSQIICGRGDRFSDREAGYALNDQISKHEEWGYTLVSAPSISNDKGRYIMCATVALSNQKSQSMVICGRGDRFSDREAGYALNDEISRYEEWGYNLVSAPLISNDKGRYTMCATVTKLLIEWP